MEISCARSQCLWGVLRGRRMRMRSDSTVCQFGCGKKTKLLMLEIKIRETVILPADDGSGMKIRFDV